ncbi:RHS repeat-associated core domain-containing protein [Streptomyces sp. NPDC002057]|uniref:RHS repeat-associated core domain-containing protein n=1 Tax=Streptomyces sp. NPDC002057 TaxID=3154664 RepID=UPI0033317196
MPFGALLLALVLPATALAQPPNPAKAEVPRDELVLEGLPAGRFVPAKDGNSGLQRIGSAPPTPQTEVPPGTATPPPAATGTVSFTTPVQPASYGTGATTAVPQAGLEPVGSLPVKLGQAPGAAAPTGTWNVTVKDRTDPLAAGVDGALLTVDAPASGSVPVSVQLDYKAYQNFYGADWASRLRFVQYPECFLTTPEVEACRTYEELETVNDTATKAITATVDTAADGTVTPAVAPTPAQSAANGIMRAAYVRPAATSVATGGDRAVVGAVDSGAGEGGSFKATPLISNGQWAAGSSSGAFSWSYPITVPPTPAGPAPKIALSYNSQAVDGRTATSAPQASWVGEGWDYDPGHIQRRYRTCKEDTKAVGGKTPNNAAKADQTSDLCWVSYNAVMSLGGQTVELVQESSGSDLYRPKNDDGTRVRLRSGGTNLDDNGEYWEVTTTDGTRYFYGLNKIGGGHADTDSVFTVPVFGNHPGEPCHAATFAASRCNTSTTKQQAWHWGLDKVIDVHGNVMIVNWHRSTNYYAVDEKTETPEKYTRGGLPDSIEYGLREDNLGGTPTAKVDFYLSQRCLAGSTVCDAGNFDKTGDPAAYRPWWDSPGNLNCKADNKRCPMFPSFWNRLRLGKIDTYGHRPGTTGLQKVDSYVLNHSFPRDWYDTSPGLWLNSVTRYGYTPGATTGTLLTKSGVSFKEYVVDANDPLRHLKDQQLPNLVPRQVGDARPGFKRPRIGVVSTEHGGDIEVVYTGGCKVQPTVAPEDNRGTCYPVRWSPDGEEKLPKLAWFNKYVVAKVIETDRITGVSKQVVTQYKYDNAAWGKSDDEFTKPDLRTYSEWRGYQQVTTIKGGETKSVKSTDPETQSYAVTRYFRGAGGAVKDSTGKVTLVADDQDQYAGMAAEAITYSGAGGRVLNRTLTMPWSVQTASRARDGGAGALLAHRSGVKQVDTIQTVGSSWQGVRTQTEVDPTYGLPVQTQTAVVKPNGTGETLSDYNCTRTEYAHNTSAGLIGLAKWIRTVATSCADYATADPATQLISATRVTFDGLAYGATPLKGLTTGTWDTNGEGTSHAVVTTMEYDPLGRIRKVTKPLLGTTETQYTPGDTGGPVTSIKTINPKGHSNTTTFDPARGLPMTATDPNGRTARNEYDAFGRLVKGWSPARSTGTQTPDVQISYQMADASSSVTRPSAVTSQTIKDDGTYAKQVTIYDGLMRPVQTQSEAHGPGRIVTDTRYNDHGRAWEQTSGYLAQGEPSVSLFKRKSDSLVPSLTRTFFDGLERPVRVATYHGMTFLNNATMAYGDTSVYIRPAGVSDPATRSYTDALGRVTRIQHYTDTGSAKYRTTTYEYDARGNRVKVTDPAGNAWSYRYDARRRLVAATDPDTGDTSMAYDAADRPISVTDVRGTVYTSYDGLSRVSAVREGSETASPTKSYTYDTLPGGLGLPASATRHDASGAYVSRITGYDIGYRPTGSETVVPANSMTTGVSGTYAYSYTYTPTGKPLTITLPAKGGLAAEKVVTRYTEDGLPESTSGATWYTSDVTYSPYGEAMRTVSGPQPYRVWTTNFLHDNTGQLRRTVVDRETADSHRVSDTRYSYDYAGRITSIGGKLTDGATSTNDNQCFTYDAMGQLAHAWTSSLTNAAGGASCQSPGGWSWGYRSDGKAARGPVAEAADAVSDTTTPDAAYSDSLKNAGPVSGTVSGGTTGYWDSYVHDVIGNRVGLTVHNPADPTKDETRTYGYGVTVPGNGTEPPVRTKPHAMAYVSSTVSANGSTYTYDGVGNTTVRDLPSTNQGLEWTRENHLATMTDDGVTTKYVYDAAGNRLLENSPSGSVLHLGETELTTSATGVITRATRTYTHTGAPTVQRSTTNGATTGHKLDVLVNDHLGTSNTVIAMAANQAVARRAFKPYGEIRGTKTAWPNKRTYLGVGIDDASGLTHIGAREYDQTAGRFVSADPVIDIGDPLQMNGYAYSNNSPISSSDPSGLFCDGCSAGGADTVWTPDHGPGCTTEGCYDTDGEYLYDVYTPPAPKNQAPAKTVSITKDADGTVYIEKMRVPSAAELQARFPATKTYEDRLKQWAQGKCYDPADQGSSFCEAAEGMGLVSYEQSASQKVVTAIIVGVVAPDTEAWAGCFGEGKLSACGSAALDIPIAKAIKGLKVTYKVVDKIDDIKGVKSVDDVAETVITCSTNSFLPGTLVLMGDGGTKPIEELEAGDRVVSTDPETGRTTIETVTAPLVDTGEKHLVRITIDTDGASGDGTARITATDGHPIWVPSLGEWLDATGLIAGQTLSSGTGTVRIVAVDRHTERATVHNLTVTGPHTYYVVAGGTAVLVHNSNPCKLLSRPNAIAKATGYTAKEIKEAIHRVKAQGAWRGIGGNRNPDMLVDPESGDVMPQMPNGDPGDVIGNIYDHLKEKD